MGANDNVIKPPMGLIPIEMHNKRAQMMRLNEVCGAIKRYCDAGLVISIEWIKEYNELIKGCDDDKTTRQPKDLTSEPQ